MFCVPVGAILADARFIVKLVPLSVTTAAGSVLTTLILYPLPVGVPAGIVALMVPELSVPAPAYVPIAVGLVKDPPAFDSCAV
jgi:hypothetical protein